MIKHDIALLGNGYNQELSSDQKEMIYEFYEIVKESREVYDMTYAKIDTISQKEEKKDEFCDYETCRRYLVARKWNLKEAKKQLLSTLKWRVDEMNPEKALTLQFWQCPKAYNNPWAFNFRCIGVDKKGRPITYTCFAEANDRFDTDATSKHVLLLLESMMKLIRKRRLQGLNQTALSRQLVMLVDFDGFSIRDNNPKLGFKIVKLLSNHYPEFLNSMILLNAPFIFNSFWSIVKSVLDEKTISKISFFKGEKIIHEGVREKLGDEIANWLIQEMKDNLEKRETLAVNGRKKYWIAPSKEGDHNPRGLESYVNSEYYIQTPGDAYENKNTI